MSTDYDVYCEDCKDHCGISDGSLETARGAIVARAALETLAALHPDIDVEISLSYKTVWPGWFLNHKGHKLAVINEYGRLEEQCWKDAVCPTCRERHHCKLKEGHEGQCSFKKPE